MAQKLDDTTGDHTGRLFRGAISRTGNNGVEIRTRAPRDLPPLILPLIQTKELVPPPKDLNVVVSNSSPTGGSQTEKNGSPIDPTVDLLSSASPPVAVDAVARVSHPISPVSPASTLSSTAPISPATPPVNIISSTHLGIEQISPFSQARANSISIPDSFLLSPLGTASTSKLLLPPPYGTCRSCRTKSAGGSPVSGSTEFWETEKTYSPPAVEHLKKPPASDQIFAGNSHHVDKINQYQDNDCSLHMSLPLLSAKKYGK